MKLEIIEVNKYNLMAVAEEPDVYVIRELYMVGSMSIRKIKECSITEILNPANLVVRIKSKKK